LPEYIDSFSWQHPQQTNEKYKFIQRILINLEDDIGHNNRVSEVAITTRLGSVKEISFVVVEK
jgi:hypothetical protein